MRRHLSLAAAMTVAAALVPGAGRVSAATVNSGPAAQVYDVTVSGTTTCHDGREFPQMFSAPVIADLNRDGHPKVVAGFPDGHVRVFNTTNGAVVWDRDTGDDVAASPTVADLDGNGNLSVIVASYSGNVYVWDANGNVRTGWPQHSQHGAYGASVQPGFFSSVAVGDVFADGRRELFATALDQYTYGWFADGSRMTGFPHVTFDSGLATPTLADLESRHRLDIVTPSDSAGGDPYGDQPGGTYWVWRPDGALVSHSQTDQVPWSSPAVADFGGGPELINGTGDNFAGKGNYLAGFNGGGATLSGFPYATGGRVFASPAVGDVLGNGTQAIVASSEDGVVHVVTGGGGNLIPPFNNQARSGSDTSWFWGGPAIAPVDIAGRNGLWVPGGNTIAGYDIANGAAAQVVKITLNGFTYSTPAVGTIEGGALGLAATYESTAAQCGQAATWGVALFSLPSAGTAMPANAWPTFHGNNARSGSNMGLGPLPTHGYWMVASDGGVFPFGNAVGWGSTGNIRLNKPIVGMSKTPRDDGYWLVASDGGIFPFGPGAPGYGSTGNIHLNQPIVGMESALDGQGYWLVASDGGIFPFGPSAHGYGSTGGIHLNQPIVGMARTRTGLGYWLVASDGGIFPFGDAVGYGSTGNIRLNQPIVGMARTGSGNGYWLVASDGGIFPFGDAVGYGSTGNIHLNKPIVTMMATPTGNGYYLVATDGGLFPFGDALQRSYGSLGGTHLNQPIVSGATTQ